MKEDPTHLLHRDPAGVLDTMEEVEQDHGFAGGMTDFMQQPDVAAAVEAARWGMARVVPIAQRILLAQVHFDVPVSVICQCLPDDLNAVPDPFVRYTIVYGSGGARRTSGLLLPGMWIAHGSDIQVIGESQNIAAAQVRVQAFVTPAPGAIPNIP